MTWELGEAKARFEEMLATSLQDGPQMVKSEAGEFVVMPREEWARARTAKEVMLAPEARCEDMMIPERGHLAHREIIDLE